MKRALVLLITLLSGCDLYWNHSSSGDDTICPDKEPAQIPIRDPNTGDCFSPPTGGCEPTDGECGCAYPVASAPSETGAYCSGVCEGLDEQICGATAGCHAQYAEPGGALLPDVTDSNGNDVTFVQCWDIEPLTPQEGGDCTTFDDVTCGMHDDCISIMDGPTGTFQECAPIENNIPPPDSCDGVDCGAGSTCETECYPCDPTDMANGCMSSCGPVCVPTTTCDDMMCGSGSTCGEACDANGDCKDACYPNGSNDPGSCTGNVTCNSAPPACPSGTTAGIENGCYSGYCIPTTKCSSDPGTCPGTGSGAAMCNIAAPSCPVNTVPGVVNGCWSGFCIPAADCPQAACETLTTANACDARMDCTPVYTGMNCTCDADGSCTCESETYARCESIEATTPPTPVMN